jgi:hypothetical protein
MRTLSGCSFELVIALAIVTPQFGHCLSAVYKYNFYFLYHKNYPSPGNFYGRASGREKIESFHM